MSRAGRERPGYSLSGGSTHLVRFARQLDPELKQVLREPRALGRAAIVANSKGGCPSFCMGPPPATTLRVGTGVTCPTCHQLRLPEVFAGHDRRAAHRVDLEVVRRPEGTTRSDVLDATGLVDARATADSRDRQVARHV